MMRSFVLTFVFVLGIVTSPQEDAKPDRTAKRLEKIQEYIGQAGQLYKDQQFQPAANKIDAAQVILERCITDDQAKYKEDLMKEHGRIARAHELLAAAGVNLKELSPFPRILARKILPRTPKPMQLAIPKRNPILQILEVWSVSSRPSYRSWLSIVELAMSGNPRVTSACPVLKS